MTYRWVKGAGGEDQTVHDSLDLGDQGQDRGLLL